MERGCFGRVLQRLVDAFQDGGLHGWIAVLGLFISKMAWGALTKSMGMMLPSLQEQFVTSTWLIGWMVAIIEASAYLSSIMATPVNERFGARTVLTVCGLVAGISMITASFLSSLYAITFILTVFTGPAIGFSYVITKHLIGCFFTKSIAMAYGLATLGSAFAFVAAVPLIQLFLDTYGWRGTMLLLGGLLLHLAVCGALMKPPAASRSQDGYEAALTDEEQETGEDKVAPSNCFGCFTLVYSFTRDTFQLGLFSSISFWLVALMYSIYLMTNSAWLIYYVQYATVYKEFTLEDASHFIVAFGLGRGFSCFVIGPLVQTVQVFSTHTWIALALLLQTIYFALDPWLTSYWLITGNAFVFGNAVSVSAILLDVVVKETFGKEQMGHVFGWTGSLAGVTFLLLLYFPGLIYDLTGDYTVAFCLLAGVLSLAVFSALWLNWRQKHHRSSI
ncbi:monocarboxylate transporter 12-like [Asterias rubens]|uniref:monocarboxylate transporter 12-like n=1 Tax=Asterias rubens TaxID=7604 RepID=UPI001455ABC9|nr:monocarboxylate transporter 12-like [Asterias rubens]